MILVVSEKLPSPSRLEHLQDKSIVIVNVNLLLINGPLRMELSQAIVKRKLHLVSFSNIFLRLLLFVALTRLELVFVTSVAARNVLAMT